MIKQYFSALYGLWKERLRFDSVETFVMFLGYPRSGHSLIGSLMDAHPDVIISHELGVLKYILAGFSKEQIYYLILKNSERASLEGRISGTYSYEVAGQWQGRYENLTVIGDKQGGGATLRLKARPWLMNNLRSKIDAKLRFIHVTRNPYDNISTIIKKNSIGLDEGIKYYFDLCETILSIKKRVDNYQIFELKHEEFLDRPGEKLAELCSFLGVGYTHSYLSDCSAIVYKKPKRTRKSISWDIKSINAVKNEIARFPFLTGYKYDE